MRSVIRARGFYLFAVESFVVERMFLNIFLYSKFL